MVLPNSVKSRDLHIQLFRQRLSHESLKAYATMPIGIMGSKSLALLNWGSRRFSNKEREKPNTCLCCFPQPLWNTLRFTQATVKTTITHNNFRRYRASFSPFVRQPFSKQLYLTLLAVYLSLGRNSFHCFLSHRRKSKCPKFLLGSVLTHFKCNGLSLLFAHFPSHIALVFFIGTLSIDNEMHDDDVRNPRRIGSRVSFLVG